MTSIEAAFYAYITAQTSVTSLVGTRVYQDLMPQKASYPAIVYSLIGEERADGYSLGTTVNGQVEARLQVASWASTAVAAREVHDAIRRLVNGYKGTWGENTIQSVFIDSTESAVDVEPNNEAARVYGYRSDLMVTFEQRENEIQLLTLSSAPLYGLGVFTGPSSESVSVDFEASLSAEQAAFDAAMSGKSPTVARPSTTTHRFTFETGSYAGTNLSEMTFTPNTTTAPLNNGDVTITSFTCTQIGESAVQPTIYQCVFSTLTSKVGWVEFDSFAILKSQFNSSGFTFNGATWNCSLSGDTMTLTTAAQQLATISTATSKLGTAVTGTMSTPLQGG